MIQLKSGTADVLRQYGILRLCFFKLFIGQFSSLSLKCQNDVPCGILAWLLPGYFVIFSEENYWRARNTPSYPSDNWPNWSAVYREAELVILIVILYF